MAMGEIGMFLPAESNYGTPGAYSEALRAEATKRASYLSQMDQFYSQLEESQRQFDEALAFKESSWEDELGLRREEMATQRKLGLGQLLLGMYQAKTARTAAKSSGEMNYLGGRDEKLDLLRDIYSKATESGGGDTSPRYGKDYDPYEKSWYLGDREDDIGYRGYGF